MEFHIYNIFNNIFYNLFKRSADERNEFEDAVRKNDAELVYFSLLSNKKIAKEQKLFEGVKTLTDLVIPPSISAIGDFYCNKCERLERVIIPSSVSKIGKSSFKKCIFFVFKTEGGANWISFFYGNNWQSCF